jgi:hypothetical protein
MRNLRRDFHRCVDLRMIGEPSASRIVCFRRHASFEIAYVILSRREASGRATPPNYGDAPSNTEFPTSAGTMGKTEKVIGVAKVYHARASATRGSRPRPPERLGFDVEDASGARPRRLAGAAA